MRSLIKPLRDAVAEPHACQAKRQRDREIGASGERPPGTQQSEVIEAEGGEGGVAAANSDHDELPPQRTDEETPVWAAERREQADDERAENVDEDRHPRKRHRP